jgi:hypothetical protein
MEDVGKAFRLISFGNASKNTLNDMNDIISTGSEGYGDLDL